MMIVSRILNLSLCLFYSIFLCISIIVIDAQNHTISILCIGDSITYGTGSSDAQLSYPSRCILCAMKSLIFIFYMYLINAVKCTHFYHYHLLPLLLLQSMLQFSYIIWKLNHPRYSPYTKLMHTIVNIYSFSMWYGFSEGLPTCWCQSLNQTLALITISLTLSSTTG